MPSNTALKQSRLGIASFILSLLALPLFFAGLPLLPQLLSHILAPFCDLSLGSYFLVLFVGLLASLLIAVVALILGIMGLIRTKHKKAFAWAGMALSVISIVVIVSYVIYQVNNFTWR